MFHKEYVLLVPMANSNIRGDVKIPHSKTTKSCRETLLTYLWNLCGKSQKQFAPSSGGIRLLYYVWTELEGPISVVIAALVATTLLTFLEGSVTLCARLVTTKLLAAGDCCGVAAFCRQLN